MSSLVHLGVRTVHVLAMAVLLGTTVGAWAALRADLVDPVPLGRRYELAFWVAVGALVLTGVGNLGALGPPGPETAWGRALTAKLAVVLAVLVGSVVRTAAVARLPTDGASAAVVRRFLRRSVAATGWSLLAVVVLAEVLAHG